MTLGVTCHNNVTNECRAYNITCNRAGSLSSWQLRDKLFLNSLNDLNSSSLLLSPPKPCSQTHFLNDIMTVSCCQHQNSFLRLPPHIVDGLWNAFPRKLDSGQNPDLRPLFFVHSVKISISEKKSLTEIKSTCSSLRPARQL